MSTLPFLWIIEPQAPTGLAMYAINESDAYEILDMFSVCRMLSGVVMTCLLLTSSADISFFPLMLCILVSSPFM